MCVFFDLGSFSTFTLVWVIGMGFALDCVQLYTFVIYGQILRKVMPRSEDLQKLRRNSPLKALRKLQRWDELGQRACVQPLDAAATERTPAAASV